MARKKAASDARATGTVEMFQSKRGFGIIKTKDGEEVFVHWKEIQTDERWPKLEAGMEVSFDKAMGEGEKEGKLRAVNVMTKDGNKIKSGAAKVTMSNLPCLGTVKFFRAGRQGFGFIDPSADIVVGGEKVSKDTSIYVSREEILCEDPEKPVITKGMEVKFMAGKNADGKIAAYKVTQPNGSPIEKLPPREIDPDAPKPKPKGKKKAAAKKAA